MVMERGHDENPAARHFETDHLQNHRHGFDHKDAAHDDQKKFLLATDCDDAKHAADGERSGVPHENLGGVTVEPEKAKTGAN
jgi:hypothetical protein